jgi:hypothetical protein
LQIVLCDIVRRSVAALDKEVTSPTASALAASPADGAPKPVVPVAEEPPVDALGLTEDRSRIVTTERELQLFAAVKAIFESSEFATAEFFDRRTRRNVPLEIAYKDTTGYLCIYFNRPSSWIVRAVIEARTPWLGLNVSPEEGERLLGDGVQRLSPHPHAEFRVAFPHFEVLSSLNRMVLAAFRKTLEDRRAEPEPAVEELAPVGSPLADAPVI